MRAVPRVCASLQERVRYGAGNAYPGRYEALQCGLNDPITRSAWGEQNPQGGGFLIKTGAKLIESHDLRRFSIDAPGHHGALVRVGKQQRLRSVEHSGQLGSFTECKEERQLTGCFSDNHQTAAEPACVECACLTQRSAQEHAAAWLLLARQLAKGATDATADPPARTLAGSVEIDDHGVRRVVFVGIVERSFESRFIPAARVRQVADGVVGSAGLVWLTRNGKLSGQVMSLAQGLNLRQALRQRHAVEAGAHIPPLRQFARPVFGDGLLVPILVDRGRARRLPLSVGQLVQQAAQCLGGIVALQHPDIAGAAVPCAADAGSGERAAQDGQPAERNTGGAGALPEHPTLLRRLNRNIVAGRPFSGDSFLKRHFDHGCLPVVPVCAPPLSRHSGVPDTVACCGRDDSVQALVEYGHRREHAVGQASR